MDDAEVFSRVSVMREIGVEKFEGGIIAVAGGAEFFGNAGEDTEEGAVHHDAFEQLEDEAVVAALPEFGDEFLEIEAR